MILSFPVFLILYMAIMQTFDFFLSEASDRQSPTLCYDTESRITFITSFHSAWYERSKKKFNSFQKTVLEKFPYGNLIVYHEDDFEELIPGVCLFDLRRIPWFEYELMNNNSGLNQYFAYAGFEDPTRGDLHPGQISHGHALFMKVTSIYHAVHNSPDNSIVFWVDTDVTFREKLPRYVLDWIRSKDVTYIPFMTKNPFLIGRRKPWGFMSYNVSDYNHQDRLLRAEFWKVESGLFAITVSSKTRSFTSKALRLYRGGMLEFARECFLGSDFCKTNRIRTNVFLNDIFVLSLLLQSDIHKDIFFNEDLKHGWFAMDGLDPWGDDDAIWGAGWFVPNFHPVSRHMPVSIVSSFHIGKYIFHHFGYHENGALAVELFNRTTEKSILPQWKVVYKYTNTERPSLYKFLLETQKEMWDNEFEIPLSDRGVLLFSNQIMYNADDAIGVLNIFDSSSITWRRQVQSFCDKYTIFVADCLDLEEKISGVLEKPGTSHGMPPVLSYELLLSLTQDDCLNPAFSVNTYCFQMGLNIDAKNCKVYREDAYKHCRLTYNSVPFLIMPDIAIGTGGPHFRWIEGNLMETELNEELISQIVEALQLGMRHIDTAEIYGNDRELSVALRRFYDVSGYQREDLWITSKVYDNMVDPITACQDIIRRLNCTYLDLLLMHTPLSFIHNRQNIPLNRLVADKSLIQIWEDFQKLVEMGLVRYIGISNFGVEEIQEILSSKTMTIIPYVNQIEYHIYLQQNELKYYCAQQGIRLGAFGVLSPLKRYFRGPADDVLSLLANKYSESTGLNITRSAILIRHAQHNGYATVLSLGSTERLSEYLPAMPDANGAMSLNLSPSDVYLLDTAGGLRHQRYYMQENFLEEAKTVSLVFGNDTYYFGPHPEHVHDELLRVCNSADIGYKLCTEIYDYYMQNVYKPSQRSTEGGQDYLAEKVSLVEDGYFIIRNLLTQQQCVEMHQSVSEYIIAGGSRLRRYDTSSGQGYYIADIKSDPSLQYIFQRVHSKIILHDVLSVVFNGRNDYRFVQRNELNINREVGWHRDRVEEFYYVTRPSLDDWAANPESASDFLIVNVLIYLQDHDTDDRGLTLELGSHKCRNCRGPAITLKSKCGDAIILDNRLLHSGVAIDKLNHESFEDRMLVSIGYGRKNIFSDEFESAVSYRNLLFNNVSKCDGAHKSFCSINYMQGLHKERS